MGVSILDPQHTSLRTTNIQTKLDSSVDPYLHPPPLNTITSHNQKKTVQIAATVENAVEQITASSTQSTLAPVVEPYPAPAIAFDPSSISTLASQQQQSSNNRNQARISEAMIANSHILGKSLSQSVCPTPPDHSSLPPTIKIASSSLLDAFLPPPIILLAEPEFHDDDMVTTIMNIVNTPSPTPSAPPFKFEQSNQAAIHNEEVLQKHNFILNDVINASEFSTCSPGSEFRNPELLDPLLKQHPLWKVSKTHNDSTNDQQRHHENNEMIAKQNHKKAKEFPDVIRQSLLGDLKLGYCCVLPISCIEKIPNAMVCPLGIVEQLKLKPDGSYVQKHRLTHDQTFTALDNSVSLNNITNNNKFPNLIYGFCLERIIYQILSLRTHYPSHRILCCKFDFAKAYRRAHYDGESAVRCIAVFEDLAYLQLRLSFGGSGCPAAWCSISEMCTDLSNDLLANKAWSPSIVRSPFDNDIPPPSRLPDDIPFEKALPTMLLPPPKPFGFSEIFIDDTMLFFIDTEENCQRAPFGPTLAIHTISRPVSNTEPLPRPPMLEADKLQAEGGPSEQKLILGWLLDTRRLTISLPLNKYIAWNTELVSLQTMKKCSRKTLEKLIGKLQHAAYFIPLARFFLGTLRAKMQSSKHDLSTCHLNDTCLRQLQTWQTFLLKASQGININLVSLRKPTNMIITDACPTGMGGYSWTSGTAWRMDLTSFNIVNNNPLEFLAIVVGIIIDQQLGNIPHLGNILALSDNSSAVSWLQRSNFSSSSPDHKLHAKIAEKLAFTCINNEFSIHPQHIEGAKNEVADILSRRFDLDSAQLKSFLLTHHSSQLPRNFRILQVPNEITSWVFSILSPEASSLIQGRKRRMKKSTEPGSAGSSSSKKICASGTIPTSISSPQSTNSILPNVSSNHSSLAVSPETSLTFQIKKNYWAGLSAKPLATWLRNSGVSRGQAQFTSRTIPTSSITSYKPYSEVGPPPTEKSTEKQL